MEFYGTTYPDTKLPCNRENMTKLVEALESGLYPRVGGILRDVDEKGETVGFCCAGVACDVSGVGTWEREDRGLHGFSYHTEGSSPASALLPLAVAEWLGIEGNVSCYWLPMSAPNEQHEVATGVSANDSGWTFKQIAARLREVYLTD